MLETLERAAVVIAVSLIGLAIVAMGIAWILEWIEAARNKNDKS